MGMHLAQQQHLLEVLPDICCMLLSQSALGLHACLTVLCVCVLLLLQGA